MSGVDPVEQAHRDWIGMLQPVGLVVVPHVLSSAGVAVEPVTREVQRELEEALGDAGSPEERLKALLGTLGWEGRDWATPGDALAVPLPEYGEVLRFDAVLGALEEGAPALGVVLAAEGAKLDEAPERGKKAAACWGAPPQARAERLMREARVPVALLCNGQEVRLIFAPRGESSGHVTWPLGSLLEVAGRPLLAALRALVSFHRVVGAPQDRLHELLARSRRAQNEVSTALAEQVLGALWELLKGLQAADARGQRPLLAGMPPEEAAAALYAGLLTLVMRLVFLLYAEDQGLMPDHPVYARYYAISGLFDRLREDAGRYPELMDQRYGAWASLLATFRLVYDGGHHAGLKLPQRHGQLFDPDRFPFLEGRPHGHRRDVTARLQEVPRVPDGAVWRALELLLMLKGDRLSYRALDVEQIGSVYEAMMGFEVQRIPGRALAVKQRVHGLTLDVPFDADALLETPPAQRSATLQALVGFKLSASVGARLRDAASVEDVAAALNRSLSRWTPAPLPPGSFVLQPGEERRRTGSHYTPRELTGPIVEAALAPALARVRTPEALLELKICDPAMGSGAFLVEACRQLAEKLVDLWANNPPEEVLRGEEPLLVARRLVARRCLYGVDKNPFAVDLARLSLWLVTMARDQAFTFLDHVLKCGDSLVGLDLHALQHLTLSPHDPDPGYSDLPLLAHVTRSVGASYQQRGRIARDDASWDDLKTAHDDAEHLLAQPRRLGDLLVSTFFAHDKDKERKKALTLLQTRLQGADVPLPDLPPHLHPFHWHLEFPEVFQRDAPGFDAIVGNPPFAGKNTIAASTHPQTIDWLKHLHPESHGNADLVAHFFRRAFHLLRSGGVFGLISTNTIAQGDTRSSGLRWICTHGGNITRATRRLKWPGMAAVIVSVVHVVKGPWDKPRLLDGREVEQITAFLFHDGGHEDPHPLPQNANKCFVGSYVLGMGFTFDDTDTKGIASSIAEMERLIEKDPRNAERIFPYIGGEDINSTPRQSHSRYVINFDSMSETEARQWPDLMNIIEKKVRNERELAKHSRAKWWHFERPRPELRQHTANMDNVMCCSRISKHFSISIVENIFVFNEKSLVFSLDPSKAFSLIQSQIHEIWARFFSSTMKDDLQYTPSTCFETFPFPPAWESNPTLEEAGRVYYEYRAALMVENNEGLTATYNRFHDPEEPSAAIHELRRLHVLMDEAVCAAYGWSDLTLTYDFLLDYEDDEDDEASTSRRKKPWRYRWPDALHDEVLARLLALNAQQAGKPAPAQEEPPKRGRGKAASKTQAKASGEATGEKKKRGRKPKGGEGQGSLV